MGAFPRQTVAFLCLVAFVVPLFGAFGAPVEDLVKCLEAGVGTASNASGNVAGIEKDAKPEGRWKHISAEDAFFSLHAKKWSESKSPKYRTPLDRKFFGGSISQYFEEYFSAHPEETKASIYFGNDFYENFRENHPEAATSKFQKDSADAFLNYLNAADKKKGEKVSFTDVQVNKAEIKQINQEIMNRLLGHLIAKKVRFSAIGLSGAGATDETVFDISPEGTSRANRWVRHIKRVYGPEVSVVCWPAKMDADGNTGGALWDPKLKLIVVDANILRDPDSIEVITHEGTHASTSLSKPSQRGSVLLGYISRNLFGEPKVAKLVDKLRASSNEIAEINKKIDSANPKESDKALKARLKELFEIESKLVTSMRKTVPPTSDPWISAYEEGYRIDEMTAYERGLRELFREIKSDPKSATWRDPKTKNLVFSSLLQQIRVAASVTARTQGIAEQMGQKLSNGSLEFSAHPQKEVAPGLIADIKATVEGKLFRVMLPISETTEIDSSEVDSKLAEQLKHLKDVSDHYEVFYNYLKVVYDRMATADSPEEVQSLSGALLKAWYNPRKPGPIPKLSSLISNFNLALGR